MARGTTLGQLVNDLRIEVGLDPNPALSMNVDAQLRQKLRMEQERLYDEFDWPFLRITFDLPLQAGERYYDVPATLNLERIEKVDYQWAGKWYPVNRHIGTDQYNIYDSDADLRIEPAERWDVKDTGSGEQIEVWPIPPGDGNLLRFTGIRKLAPLLNDPDRADLDDQVLVLFAAAEQISDQKKAAEKRQKAVTRLHTLEGRVTHTRSNSFVLGGAPQPDERHRPRSPLVAYVR